MLCSLPPNLLGANGHGGAPAASGDRDTLAVALDCESRSAYPYGSMLVAVKSSRMAL